MERASTVCVADLELFAVAESVHLAARLIPTLITASSS